jgi:hypothetical protein
MGDFILLMHGDAAEQGSASAWQAYIEQLQAVGAFSGGSAIGTGLCLRKSGDPASPSDHLTGYIRVEAASLDDARRLVIGNPVFESGGTVEIRALPAD